jgi:hypothetical protein
MRGKSEGLYLWTRHSGDCRYYRVPNDRDQSRRCNCVRYIAGTAEDGRRLRESTGTTSWERARKILALKMAEHDPTTKPLLPSIATSDRIDSGPKSISDAIDAFIETKRGESISDMSHYEGLFVRELQPWCKERGIFDVAEINLDVVTRFRNQLRNKASVKNRKVSRIRSFLAFCVDRKWASENAARKLKPAREDEPIVDYFHPHEMKEVLEACFVSHEWERGRDSNTAIVV